MNKEMDELKKVCEPLIKYLDEQYDPHTYVIISQEYIKLQRTEISIPTNCDN